MNQKTVPFGHFSGNIGSGGWCVDMDRSDSCIIHVHTAGTAQRFQKDGKLSRVVFVWDGTICKFIQDAVRLSVIDICHIFCDEAGLAGSVIVRFHRFVHPDIAVFSDADTYVSFPGTVWTVDELFFSGLISHR